MTADRTIKLTLQFDGTHYHGWQRQKDLPTVQGDLENALQKLYGEHLTAYGCSRTDSGVHAECHVSHFYPTLPIPLDGVLRGLNSMLSAEIVVLNAEAVPADFSAKRNSLFKIYRYQLYNQRIRSAFHQRYSWHQPRPLDQDAIRSGAAHLVGKHDFTSFRAAGCDALTPVRFIESIGLRQAGPLLHLHVKGNAFLRQMVRNIVGTLVEVGRSRRPPGWVKEVLEARDRTLAGPTAPPQGLFLQQVAYHHDHRLPAEPGR